jgi:hypothetical protein
VHTAIGKAQLLIKEKLNQFRELCAKNIVIMIFFALNFDQIRHCWAEVKF